MYRLWAKTSATTTNSIKINTNAGMCWALPFTTQKHKSQYLQEIHIEIVINQLKNKKLSESGSLLKCETIKLDDCLACIFTQCINGENIPEESRISYIKSSHKKENRLDCNNCRDIY